MKLLRFFFLAGLVSSNISAWAQFTSNLPIIKITTPAAITATQAQGTMSIIDNVSGVNNDSDPATFTGMIGIKTRGNAAYAKQSFTVETWSAPSVSVDTALLGMPRENDWVLLGHYPDRTLFRANLAFILHDKMGRYAPRMKHCELIVNNQYVGIYNFGEVIKRDAGRLALATLTINDNSGHNMTGGYIWKIDDGAGFGWQSAFQPPYGVAQKIDFLYDSPDNSDITQAQEAYIKSYVDSFEAEMNAANFADTINGWRKHGAVNSFIDFMIIQELSRNNEAYRQNAYFFKDKGTKMRPGPLWGFDMAWKNTANCNSSKDTGWCYNYGGACPSEAKLPPFWWSKLATDAEFMKDLKCRYTEFRKSGNLLDTVEIFKAVDSMKTRLNANGALTRNFVQWPIWGIPLINEPTPMAADYNTEIANLKQFIKSRIAWLDSKWTSFNCVWAAGTRDISIEDFVTVYPIPASHILTIEISDPQFSKYSLILFNSQGNTVQEYSNAKRSNDFNVSSLSKGIYFVQIKSDKSAFVKKVVVE